MPRLLLETDIPIRWTDVDGRTPKEKLGSDDRSSGVHLSGIIRYCLDLDKSDRDPDFMPLCMALGLAWEAWAVGLFPDVVWQPGEEELDGVFCTPDGMSVMGIGDNREVVLEEWKATYKSRARYGSNILGQPLWMWQLCGMCKVLGVRYARLHIFWIAGDYRPPTPKYVTYLIEFSQTEIDLFWDRVILTNKDKAIPEEH